jgi:hypothetical protein
MAVFDLRKVTKLVEDKKPSRILIIDTNVIMNEPDYNKWKVEDDVFTLFILSSTIFAELESIRQRERGKSNSETFEKATSAVNNMAELFNSGYITEGIPIRLGWIVGIPSPNKASIDPELEQMEEIVSTFHRSDARLLLLTRECHQEFKAVPVTLVTGDKGFFEVVSMQGVPSYLHSGFPILNLKTVPAITEPIDWKAVINGTEEQTDDISVAVEVKLTSVELSSPWLKFHTDSEDFEIAKGFGSVNLYDEVRPFFWTISYYQSCSLPELDDKDGETIIQPAIHLDFFGNEPDQNIFDGIADRLMECTGVSFQEGIPTLQNPESILQSFTIMLIENECGKGGAEAEAELFDAKELIEYWLNLVSFDYGDEAATEREEILRNVLNSTMNHWKIGQTYKFNVIR